MSVVAWDGKMLAADRRATMAELPRRSRKLWRLRHFQNPALRSGEGDDDPVCHSFFAFGTGRDFAMGAMAMGASARQAVRVACRFNIYCGNGIDALAAQPSSRESALERAA